MHIGLLVSIVYAFILFHFRLVCSPLLISPFSPRTLSSSFAATFPLLFAFVLDVMHLATIQ